MYVPISCACPAPAYGAAFAGAPLPHIESRVRMRTRDGALLRWPRDDVVHDSPFDDTAEETTNLYVVGLNGQIEVDDERVQIRRGGVMGHTTQGLRGLIGRVVLADIVDIEITYPAPDGQGLHPVHHHR